MTNPFPHADHLTNEEVDYELVIRGKAEETKCDPEVKYRLLRNLFHEDVRENRDYPSPYTIDQEYDYIMGRVETVSRKLDNGPDERVISRLKHYLLRVMRCQTPDLPSEQMRRELSNHIRSILNRSSGRKGPDEKQSRALAADARRESLGKEGVEEGEAGAVGGQSIDDSVEENNDIGSPVSNQGQALEGRVSDQSKVLLDRIAQLERELLKSHLADRPRASNILAGNGINGGTFDWRSSGNGNTRRNATSQLEVNRQNFHREERAGEITMRSDYPQEPRYDERSRNEGYNLRDQYQGDRRRSSQPLTITNDYSRLHFGRSYYERDEAQRRNNLPYYPRGYEGERIRPSQGFRNSGNFWERSSGLSSDDEEGPDVFHRQFRQRRHRRISDAEIQNADRRMEKWHLTFSGDARQRSLEDFLHQIRRLATMDRIADDVLLQRVHTILRGEAYDWYLCYSDEFLNWEDFEEKIRYMYGNPNKDQGNRQRIYERKQLRQETFLSFKMEIERLNKLLTRPLDQERLFEVIWDNMRPHYRSKLACRTVRDLRKLEYYAYRIDAHDPAYRHARDGPSRPANVHRIEVEEKVEDSYSSYSEPEELNALDRKYDRDRKRHPPVSQQSNQIPESGKVCEVRVQTESCPHVTVQIFDNNYDALLDSGASVSVTNIPDIAERNGLALQPSPLKIVTADKTVHESLGYVQLPIRFRGVTKILPTLVVPQVSRALILGYDFWKRFGIQPMVLGENGFEQVNIAESTGQPSPEMDTLQVSILPIATLPALKQIEPDETLDIPALELPEASKTTPETVETEHELTTEERKQLAEVIRLFPCTTENRLGRTTLLQHEIVLREEAKPTRTPLYRCSPAVQAEMEAELERYKRMDAIEECTSEWASALVPVRKANGKLRVCLDSRRINAWTKKDSYPMRNMGGIFHRLGKAKYYSVVDLKDAYFQIPLKMECRDYTAFRTPQGLFRFKVCPFGLTNAPFTMCRLMDRVIGFDLEPNVFVYLDDIVIATETLAEHMRLLRIVADRLSKANLTISLDKSRFCRKQVTYLGYLLTEEGVSIDNSRISPILDYARPRNVKDIRRLLGLAGFYQRFIRDYSRIVAPISDLLKKSRVKFQWTEAAEAAFGELRAALVSAPILGNPNFALPFSIESDASDNAVGAALVQQQDGEQKVIAYFSKKLSSTQRKYASVEKECLGVLLAIEHFRHYVEGMRFKVVTDARSLLWLFTIGVESGNAKLLRWALKIQSYNIELEYRKGRSNILADCLLRSIETVSVQVKDGDHRELMARIGKEPAKFPDFRMVGGQVLKLVKADGKVEDARFQWKHYPPKSERADIVRTTHERAHLGPEKTLASIRERYYWPLMSSEVKRFCQRCLTCQMSKATNQNTTPPMAGQKKMAQYPWQFLAMDYVGPLPASGKGRSTCLLVVTDLFSKFVIVQPFRQATAESLVSFVENSLFLMFGVPEVILSDNGTQFVSQSFQNLLTRYHVTHWRTPNYHPQINDSERVNRVITTAIRACIRKDHREWTNNLQQIADAVRNSVHDATRHTPYFVMFGRNRISDGREYRQLRDSPTSNDGLLGNEEQKKLLADVRKNLQTAYEKHSSYYNLRSNAYCATYSVGERVLKKNTEQSDKGKGFCAKLAPKYVPAIVRRVVGAHCYDLEDLGGRRMGIFHCKFLKKLAPPNTSLSPN
ncbi:uncharacterized protein LOC131687751 [Topomyia yanbarensis]|uniref:uncharacterized protein LOC131687751 n=1 Tax=Topomyia yanbarensis TaxID=2498891 RepID=UPI00273AFCAD|nr:uncharacterized protein LOC131687751 [Topomyia yanbarensis]